MRLLSLLLLWAATTAVLHAQPLNEGFVSHLVDSVHTDFHLDGSGVQVGILAEGYTDYLPADYVTGTFTPAQGVGTGQQGSVLAEIVHSLAPAAAVHGYLSGSTLSQRVANINQAVSDGCSLILLDTRVFPEESPYQESLLQDAVRAHAANGILFMVASGDRNRSAVWEGPFESGGTIPALGDKEGEVEIHVFNGRDENALTNETDGILVRLYWNEPWGTASSDYDLFAIRQDGDTPIVVNQSLTYQNGNDNPYEELYLDTALHGDLSDIEIVVTRYAGNDQQLYLEVERATLAKSTDTPQRGISLSPFVVPVGAVKAGSSNFNEYKGVLRSYTPYGAQTVYLASNGSPMDDIPRFAPLVLAQDGISTSLSNFSVAEGSAVAAAQVTGIVALLYQYLQGDIAIGALRENLSASGLEHSLLDNPELPEPVAVNARWVMENANGSGPHVSSLTKFMQDTYLAEGDEILLVGEFLETAQVFLHRAGVETGDVLTVLAATPTQLRVQVPRIEDTRLRNASFRVFNSTGSYYTRGTESLQGAGNAEDTLEVLEHYPPPQITSVDQPVFEDYLFDVRGYNLAGVTEITLDGYPVNTTVDSSQSPTSFTKLVTYAPVTTTGVLRVTGRNGTGSFAPVTVGLAPRFDTITPRRGKPGDVVNFYGERLSDVEAVIFSSRKGAGFTVHSDLHFSAVIPADAVSGRIICEFPTFTANLFTQQNFEVLQKPAISEINARVSIGDTIEFSGNHLEYPLYAEILQEGKARQIDILAGTSIVIPDDISGAVTLRLVTEGGVSNEVATRVVGTPVIYGTAPGMGERESVVTLVGDNFIFATAVTLNGQPQFFTISGYNLITVKLDAFATSGIFEVTTPQGTAQSSSFTVSSTRPQPQVTSMAPWYWVAQTLPVYSNPIQLPKLFGTDLAAVSQIRLNGVTVDFYYARGHLVMAPRATHTEGALELFYGEQSFLSNTVYFFPAGEAEIPQFNPVMTVIEPSTEVVLRGTNLGWLSTLGDPHLPFEILSETEVRVRAPATHLHGHIGSWSYQKPWSLEVGIPFGGTRYQDEWVEVPSWGWTSYTEAPGTFFNYAHGYLQAPQAYTDSFWYYDYGMKFWCYFNPAFYPWLYSPSEGWMYHMQSTLWPARWFWTQARGWIAED